jgi:hypothetical protein
VNHTAGRRIYSKSNVPVAFASETGFQPEYFKEFSQDGKFTNKAAYPLS